MRSFDELKQWKKKALHMSVFGGESGAEIARKLKVPARTVQDNLKRLKGLYTLDEIRSVVDNKINIKPMLQYLKDQKAKILFHDIETSLAVSFHFGQWQQNLGIKSQIHESHLLSHSWAWNDGEVHGSILTREEVMKRDDKRLVLELWHLLDECDVYVAHNGKKFDVRKINGYFLKYNLPPPSPYKVVDTVLISRRKFGLPFHNLAYLAKFLNVTHKIDNSGIELWIACAYGDQDALNEMLEYNIGDIVTLREVYYKIIMWDNEAVNMSLYQNMEGLICPHCGSDSISLIVGKFVYTAQRRYRAYRCNTCTATSRGGSLENEDVKLYRVV